MWRIFMSKGVDHFSIHGRLTKFLKILCQHKNCQHRLKRDSDGWGWMKGGWLWGQSHGPQVEVGLLASLNWSGKTTAQVEQEHEGASQMTRRTESWVPDDYSQVLRADEMALMSVGHTWEPWSSFSLLSLPLGVEISALCLSRHCILEVDMMCPGFTGPQMERTFPERIISSLTGSVFRMT